MDREIARLKCRQYQEQLNIWLSSEVKRRLLRLKLERKINTAEECRKAIERLVSELERVEGIGAA